MMKIGLKEGCLRSARLPSLPIPWAVSVEISTIISFATSSVACAQMSMTLL